jgi:hypothetical protein
MMLEMMRTDPAAALKYGMSEDNWRAKLAAQIEGQEHMVDYRERKDQIRANALYNALPDDIKQQLIEKDPSLMMTLEGRLPAIFKVIDLLEVEGGALYEDREQQGITGDTSTVDAGGDGGEKNWLEKQVDKYLGPEEPKGDQLPPSVTLTPEERRPVPPGAPQWTPWTPGQMNQGPMLPQAPPGPTAPPPRLESQPPAGAIGGPSAGVTGPAIVRDVQRLRDYDWSWDGGPNTSWPAFETPGALIEDVGGFMSGFGGKVREDVQGLSDWFGGLKSDRARELEARQRKIDEIRRRRGRNAYY